jgi:hypothetical protein
MYISTDPGKIDKVVNWSEPTSTKEVQQFVGFANYYRRFIQAFSQIAKPLHRLTERNCPFKWTPECQQSFDKLKAKLTTAPVLAYPDYSRPFILDTDASDFGIGAVLSQKDDEGRERVIAFASRSLSKAERRYCVTRRELLAVVVFTQHFRPYLLGREFTLRTDHGSLTWLQSFRDPEGQLARWLEKLQQFNFNIVHRQGKSHQNADALSRLPCNQCGREHQVVAHISQTSGSQSHQLEMRKLQQEDPDLNIVLKAKEKEAKPEADEQKAQTLESRRLLQLWEQLVVRNGVLFRQWESQDGSRMVYQLVMPKSERENVKKLHKWWTGPFKVVKRLSEVTYRIQHIRNRAKRLVVHFDRLKRCHPNIRLSEQFKNTQPPTDKHTSSNEQQPGPTNNEFGTYLEIVEDVDSTISPHVNDTLPPPNSQTLASIIESSEVPN